MMTKLEMLVSDAEARRLVEGHRWYHSYDFGGFQTRWRSSKMRSNQTLFGVFDMLNGVDVNGMDVLEVGPAHGIVSVGLAMRGARVSTADIGGKRTAQIDIAASIFGVSIEQHHSTPLEAVGKKFPAASFDLIVCAGVMYHLINPTEVFFRLRPLLRRNGLLIMETVYSLHKEPVITVNSETGEFGQRTTYFLPSRTALEGMAKLACFDVLATRVNSPQRFSMTAKAVMPEEIRDRSEMCRTIHDYGKFEDPMFPFSELIRAGFSTIHYAGAPGHKVIDVAHFDPAFAPCPREVTVPVGQVF